MHYHRVLVHKLISFDIVLRQCGVRKYRGTPLLIIFLKDNAGSSRLHMSEIPEWDFKQFATYQSTRLIITHTTHLQI